MALWTPAGLSPSYAGEPRAGCSAPAGVSPECSGPAGHTAFDEGQDTQLAFCAASAHCQLISDFCLHYPQVFLLRAALNPFSIHMCLCIHRISQGKQENVLQSLILMFSYNPLINCWKENQKLEFFTG